MRILLVLFTILSQPALAGEILAKVCPLANEIREGLEKEDSDNHTLQEANQIESFLSKNLGLEVKGCELFKSDSAKKSEKFDTLKSCLTQYALSTWFKDNISGFINISVKAASQELYTLKLIWRPVDLPSYRWWDYILPSQLINKFVMRSLITCHRYPDLFVSIESDRPVPIANRQLGVVLLNSTEPYFNKLVLSSKLEDDVIKVQMDLFEDADTLADRTIKLETTWRPFSSKFELELESTSPRSPLNGKRLP